MRGKSPKQKLEMFYLYVLRHHYSNKGLKHLHYINGGNCGVRLSVVREKGPKTFQLSWSWRMGHKSQIKPSFGFWNKLVCKPDFMLLSRFKIFTLWPKMSRISKINFFYANLILWNSLDLCSNGKLCLWSRVGATKKKQDRNFSHEDMSISLLW